MTVIEVEDVWKKYRLGVIGTGTLRHDFERWWYRVRGKPDPHAKVGEPAKAENGKSKSDISVSLRGVGSSEPEAASQDFSISDDEVWALRSISFEVKQGEILGIVGRNGAGKSTLLKILSRVTAPTKGEVRVKGRIASLLEVGTGFHPELTGRENIFLNGAILGMTKPEIRSKLDEIVAFAGIETYIDTPVKRYSSGMYVRLAFAVAAHLEPEILIVDEVLAVGDAEFQKKCLGKMEEISNGGRTVLFVSHNMDAVQRLCSRGLLLKDGTIVVDGDIRRAVAKYSVRDTAQVPIIDLQRLARPPFVRLRARCTHVRMMSADNHSGWHISYGDQLGFAVSVENDCLLSGLELGISIFSSSSLEITSNLSSHMFTMEKTAAGRHMFRVTYPKLRLIPGSYYVQLGLRSEAGFEDFLPKACEFEVLTSELSSTQMTDTFRGLLVPEAAYEFATLE